MQNFKKGQANCNWGQVESKGDVILLKDYVPTTQPLVSFNRRIVNMSYLSMLCVLNSEMTAPFFPCLEPVFCVWLHCVLLTGVQYYFKGSEVLFCVFRFYCLNIFASHLYVEGVLCRSGSGMSLLSPDNCVLEWVRGCVPGMSVPEGAPFLWHSISQY